MDQNNYIFEVEDLCKYFPAGKKKVVKAVDGINLKIRKGRDNWSCWRIWLWKDNLWKNDYQVV